MLRRLRASNPALIVASLALVAALAGTAVADQQATTSAKKLNKKQKKQTKKIATNKADKAIDKLLPIDTNELAGAAVNSAKLGKSSVIASKIADGVVNAKKLGAITERTSTISVFNGSQNNTTVPCNANEVVISGGAQWDSLTTLATLQQSHRVGNGWNAGGQNGTGAPKDLTIKAYCLSA